MMSAQSGAVKQKRPPSTSRGHVLESVVTERVLRQGQVFLVAELVASGLLDGIVWTRFSVYSGRQ